MKRVLLFLLIAGLLLLIASPAFGQVSFGLKAGLPVTETFRTGSLPNLRYLSDTKRYTLGPTVEVKLPFGLGVELDALYKRLDYETSAFDNPVSQTRTTANSWEFPLLLKYRFEKKGVVQPFLDTGASFHHISGLKQVGTLATAGPSEFRRSFNGGWVLGGGLDIHAILIRISPELRYTRWTSANFENQTNPSAFQSKRNQVELLVGFTF